MLKRDTTLRELIKASARIQAMAFDAPEDSRDVVDYAEKQIFDVTGINVRDNAAPLSQIMGELYEGLGEMAASGDTMFGVKTGYRGIDEALQVCVPDKWSSLAPVPGWQNIVRSQFMYQHGQRGNIGRFFLA
jgi:replicative DNA helicase